MEYWGLQNLLFHTALRKIIFKEKELSRLCGGETSSGLILNPISPKPPEEAIGSYLVEERCMSRCKLQAFHHNLRTRP